MSISPLHTLLIAALILTATAAVTDLRTGLIPNRLVLVGLSIGLLGNLALGYAMSGSAGILPGLIQCLGGMLACAPIPLFLFLVRGLAGGDVKLFLALGSLLGPLAGLQAQLYAFVVGALYVLGLLAYEGVFWRTVGGSIAQVTTALLPRRMRVEATPETQRTVRFAPAICFGTALTLLSHLGGP